jgi:putative transposase
MVMHQLLKTELRGCSKYRRKEADKEVTNITNKSKSSASKGRPKGSKSFNRRDVQLSEYLETLLQKITMVQGILSDDCKPQYLLFDGEMGNNFGVQMASRAGLNLISKLRRDSKLYLPWQGEYSGRGRKNIYGERLNPQNIPDKYCIKTKEEGDSRIEYFQIEAHHKMFPDALNIVLIRKTKLSSNKVGHVILFTSDLGLAWDKVVDYYSLRFQIEFNFRDAKQYWGLEDFMVIKKNKIQNSACFSMFMVNISYALITNQKGKIGQSVHDLKVWFLARKQVLNTLKLCGGNAQAIFNTDLINRVSMKFMVNTS